MENAIPEPKIMNLRVKASISKTWAAKFSRRHSRAYLIPGGAATSKAKFIPLLVKNM
jgi:hypothetical protein